jgi:cytochrome c oxidase subunit II
MKARNLAILGVLASQGYCISSALAISTVPQEWQITLPTPVTDVARHMQSFNTLLLAIIVPIVIFVMCLLIWVMFRYRENSNPVPSKTSHNTMIEVIWTIVPVLILVVIAIPSFRILFEQYSFPKADVTIKATGRQWYWSYEYPDVKGVSFDSNLVDPADLKPGQIRNLSVDNAVVVPVNKVVQVLITGGDVIHQWVVPSFGSRADGVPGRMNRTWFRATETGTFYGQCSALCGQGHAFMPIEVRVVPEDEYNAWVQNKQKAASLSQGKLADAGQPNQVRN